MSLEGMFDSLSDDAADEDASDAEQDEQDDTGGSRYSGSMADGGYPAPFDRDDPRLNDDGTFDWEAFNAKVLWKMEGTIQEYPDAEALHHDASDTRIEYEADFTQTELLGANIINIDFIFDPDVLYDGPSPVELDDEREFWRDSSTFSIQVDVAFNELIAAAIQRGREDSRHPAYILGGWANQARSSEQVTTGYPFVKAFEAAKDHFESFPEDATMQDYRGGYEG